MSFVGLRKGALLVILAGINQIAMAGVIGEKDIWQVIEGMGSVRFEESAIEEFFGAPILKKKRQWLLEAL